METRRRWRKPCREKYRDEDEANNAKIEAKNILENYCFTVRNTHTEEKLKDKFARRQSCDAGHRVEVQGRELRGQEDLKRNTDSIEMLELENMMSQAALDMEDDEHAANLEKLTLTNADEHVNAERCSGRITFSREWTHEHQFIKERLES